MTVYTWGYTRVSSRSVWPVDELHRLRQARNALIVDVRFKPASRFRQWGQRPLERAFGDDYLWIQEFGNVNWASWTKPVVLADPATGLAQLKPLVSAERPPLLLCMCPDTFCHRTNVAVYLAQHAGWVIEHLVPEHRRRATNGVA